MNVVTSNDPSGVSHTPASRSSMAESIRILGQLQDSPPSLDRIISTQPNGHTCACLPPEQTTMSSPFERLATVGQPW